MSSEQQSCWSSQHTQSKSYNEWHVRPIRCRRGRVYWYFSEGVQMSIIQWLFKVLLSVALAWTHWRLKEMSPELCQSVRSEVKMFVVKELYLSETIMNEKTINEVKYIYSFLQSKKSAHVHVMVYSWSWVSFRFYQLHWFQVFTNPGSSVIDSILVQKA